MCLSCSAGYSPSFGLPRQLPRPPCLGLSSFLTSLFYLISSSDAHAQYRPYQWIANVMPNAHTTARAVVESVFHMTVTISVCHGLFTWLTFHLLGAKLVYLSTSLSALFGVLPFLGAHWIVIPAMAELWLVQHKKVSAVVLLASHIIVTWFIDPLIYGENGDELEGGLHPYLVGLSVVGGLFLFGPEGGLIGPFLLIVLQQLLQLVSNPRARKKATKSF